jgi:DNA invertase Pin-like site-specific DNA recombinase
MKATTKAPLIISYLRFSRPEQMHGDSERRQTELAERWCAENGYTLTDRLADKGISAFRGQNLTDGHLAAFLTLVKNGTVPQGSILLVEDLDRISRTKPQKALRTFFDIIESGVTVVTLRDKCVYPAGEELDMNQLMLSVMRFCLAHEESKKKGERVAEAWIKKRKAIKQKPLTTRVPGWLRVEGDKVVIDKPKADLVRRMFTMAREGRGLWQIVRTLNAETGNKGIVRKRFTIGYVSKILHMRAAIGEFQPHTYRDGKRQPIGDAIRGYYPPIISEEEFYAVQQSIASRRHSTGPKTKHVNLFAGLLWCREDGSAYLVQTKRTARRYSSEASIRGDKGHAPYVSFPVLSMEEAVMTVLTRPGLFTEGTAANFERDCAAADAVVKETERKIRDVQNLLLNGAGEAAPVVELLVKLDAKLKAAIARRDEIKSAHHAAAQSREVDDYFELAERARAGQLTEDERYRLRAVYQRIIERIDASLTREGRNYYCDAEIILKSGGSVPLRFAAILNRGTESFRVDMEDEVKAPVKIVKAKRATPAAK